MRGAKKISARRSIALLAMLAAVEPVSGCDTVSQMESWLPGASSFEITQDKPSLEVQFHGIVLKDAKPDEAGTGIALQLDDKADTAEFAELARLVPDWIVGTHTDADTANIVIRQAADLSAEPTEDGFVLRAKFRQIAGSDTETAHVGAEPADDPGDGMQREDLDVPFGVAEAPAPETPPRGSL